VNCTSPGAPDQRVLVYKVQRTTATGLAWSMGVAGLRGGAARSLLED
jgi:hypothetical protein